MSAYPEPILRIPPSVREEALAYRSKFDAFSRGETTPVAFKAYRVSMGIYEHREAGRFMVRVRLGAGMALPHQLARIAGLSAAYGNGTVHVTTRQDIQIHDVSLNDTPEIQEGLLEAGLSSRGGGGNTVRNVSACPRSGSCPEEIFDVGPYAIAAAEYLLQHRNAYNLPRKYKIAFSGCAEDCALASAADLGFFARMQAGEPGFSVFAGGGLGMHPRVGVRVEEFIPAAQAVETAEAVRRVFDGHGDRTNRHRARLRYVVARIGPEAFKELYRRERTMLRSEGLTGEIPEVRDLSDRFRRPPSGESPPGDISGYASPYLMPEKDSRLATLRLALPLGDISAAHLETAALTAERYGQGLVRTTQLQELLITGVPWDRASKAIASLESAGLIKTDGEQSPRIVTCTGAATCKLGLCQSRHLATALTERLETHSMAAHRDSPVIRISGCPNSCGAHHIAGLGFEGRAQRHHGRMMPSYAVLAGGRLSEGDSRLAEVLGTVPAKRIPDLVSEALAGDGPAPARLRELVSKYAHVDDDLPEDYYCDFGSDEAFSLAGRSPGECGAGVFEVIKLDINEAERALQTAQTKHSPAEKNEALYHAVLAASRALLLVYGHESRQDDAVFAAFEHDLISPGWVRPETRTLIRAAQSWKKENTEALASCETEAAALVERIEQLFASLDADLKFRIAPAVEVETAPPDARGDEPATHIDLRGVPCPINFVKAKVALEKLPVGGLLEVALDAGAPAQNVPASMTEHGQEVLAVEAVEEWYVARIRRTH